MKRGCVVVGALFMIGSLLPAAGAHWGFGETDPARPSGVATDNVAGTVVGTAGAAIVGTAGDALGTAAYMHCDMEFMPPGDSATPYSEAEIDESPNPFAPSLPDNVWNDGGVGGACHAGGYLIDAFNTPGCSGTTHASVSDLSANLGVPVLAACDAGSVSFGGSPTALEAFSAAICASEATIQGTLRYVSCLDPLTSSGSGFANCSNDGVADDVNGGYAGPVGGPTVPSVTCGVMADTDGNEAMVAVLSTVDLRGTVGELATHVWVTGSGSGGESIGNVCSPVGPLQLGLGWGFCGGSSN